MTPLFVYLAFLVLIFIVMVLSGLFQIGGKLQEFGSKILDGLGTLLSEVQKLSEAVIGTVTNFGSTLVGVFGTTIALLESGATEGVTAITESLSTLLNVYGSQLVNLIDLLGNVGSQIYSMLVSYGTNILDYLGQISAQYIGRLLQFLGDAFAVVIDFLRPLIDFLASGFDFWYQNVVEPLASLMSQFLGSMIPMLISILRSLQSIFDGGLGKALSFLKFLPF